MCRHLQTIIVKKLELFVDGIEIQSFDYLKSNYQNYNVILGVGGNVVCDIANQLVNAGIDNFITYLQMIDYSSPCIISAEMIQILVRKL